MTSLPASEGYDSTMATQLEIIENQTSHNSQISESETKKLEQFFSKIWVLYIELKFD